MKECECGGEWGDHANFCGYCGKSLGKEIVNVCPSCGSDKAVYSMVKQLKKFKESIEKKRKKELQDLFHKGRLARRKLIGS